jgi:hypothetical protein
MYSLVNKGQTSVKFNNVLRKIKENGYTNHPGYYLNFKKLPLPCE